MSRFTVSGVDRETGLDTELVVYSEFEDNARIKAELKGMTVTRIVQQDKPKQMEQTPKPYKAIQAVGVLCMILGMVVMFLAFGLATEGYYHWTFIIGSFLILLAGLVVYLGVRIIEWWMRG